MPKAIPTRARRPVPAEYEANFVQQGHEACDRMYGKRASTRYRFALGAARLKRLRRSYLKAGTLVSAEGKEA